MTRSFFTKAGIATIALAAAAFVPAVAQAQFTTINVAGQAQISDPDPTANPTGGTLIIDFVPVGGTNGTIFAFNNNFGIPLFTAGQIADLDATVSGFTPESTPFISLGGYTFTYGGTTTGGTFGPIFLTQQGPNVTAGFNVFGTVTGPGFPDTRSFNASFSAQFNNTTIGALVNSIDTGTSTPIVTYSGLITVSPIPEPSTYALMGAGVAMLGAFARRRKLQQA